MPDSEQELKLASADAEAPFETEARSTPALHVADLEHPWLGLESFREETREYFFGRDAEIAELHLRLRNHPLLVLYGRSGLGKTSILMAGLVPRLHDEQQRPLHLRLRYEDTAPDACSQLVSAVFGWGDRQGGPICLKTRPTKSLEWTKRLGQELKLSLPEDPPSRVWLRLHYRDEPPDITHLILDQFEEVFTLGAQRPGAESGVRDTLAILLQGAIPEAISRAIVEHDSFVDHFDLDSVPVRVILALRDDFVYALNRWRRHLPALGQNNFELRALRGPAAFEAVFNPGELRCHYRGKVSNADKTETGLPPIVSEDTAQRIVRFFAKKGEEVPIEEIEAVPPILSLLCRELNERRFTQPAGSPEAPAAHLMFRENDADIETIIASFYKRCLAGLPEAVRIFIEEELVRYSGVRLVQDEKSILTAFEEGCEIPGAAHGRRAPGFGDVSAARACLHDLVNQRLLSALGDRTRSYELVHDLLAGVVEKSRTAARTARLATETERRQQANAKLREEMRKVIKNVNWRALAAFVAILFLWLQAEVRLGDWWDKRAELEVCKSAMESDTRKSCFQINVEEFRETKRDANLLFDNFGIKVVVSYPAAFFAAIVLWLLMYLRRARDHVLHLLTASVKAARQLGESAEAAASKSPRGAWWLAPLPSNDGTEVTARQLESALRWQGCSRRNTILVALTSGALAFIVCRITYRGLVTAKGLLRTTEYGYWQNVIWPTLLIFCAAWALFQIYAWWRQRRVSEFEDAKIKTSFSRRQFLAAFVIACVAASFPIVAPVLKRIRSNPRFRLVKPRRSAPEPMLPIGSFRHNSKSGIFHGILPSKAARPSTSAASAVVHCLPRKPETMDPAPDAAIPLEISLDARGEEGGKVEPRVQLARAACAFEQAALLRIASKDIEGACQLLLGGVRHDMRFSNYQSREPSIHIYDLLAGLAVRHGLPHHLGTLKKLIAEAPKRTRAFVERQKVWENRNSKWHKRWVDKSKLLKWSGLPM